MAGNTARSNDSLAKHNDRKSITVTVASARPEFAAELQSGLKFASDFDITRRPVVSGTKLNPTLKRLQPDVLVLGKRLFDSLDEKSQRAIHKSLPDLRVLLLCKRERKGLINLIVSNRFHGLLRRNSRLDTIVKAIHKVSHGELWLPRAMLEKAIFEAASVASRHASTNTVEPTLTRRESEAVEYVCQGLTNKEIGLKLGIREDTVKKHLHSVYGKLGIRCRTQLMARHIGSTH